MFTPRAYRSIAFCSIMFLILSTNIANAITIVVPNVDTNVDTGGANAFLFGDTNSQRSQQVYSSDQFASLTGPEYITQIAFRPSVFFSAGPFTATSSDIQVDLSTTLKTPDNLSLTFANNIGSDDTTVLHGPLTISSTATGSPTNFSIIVPFTTPFLYDPSKGNLLLDVRNFSGASQLFFMQIDGVFGDSVSRVYTNAQLNDVNNPTAFGSDTVGLVTQFTTVPVTQPVPEPTTVVLLCLGIAAFAIAQWLRKRKSQPLEGAIG